MDFIQIIIKTIIAAGDSQFLRKIFETKKNEPEIDKYLKYAWIGALLFVSAIGFISEKESDKIFNYFLLSFVIYITYKIDDPKISRTLFIAILPLFFASTFDNITEYIAPKFHKLYHDQLNSIRDFTFLWLIGFSIYAYRQNKKDREIRQKEQAEHDLLLSQKNTLEYQVAERTAEITQQKEALEKSVIELKATQNQLVNAEKMASLGELTAGIAHEIQNPLNFVNNFSEVSVELCDELNEHLEKGEIDKKYIQEIIADLSQNQQKITHHGQRASSIVKGMLLHSRTSTGDKELTDINALADEYLRLSYHGLRAKDKNFNADFKTDFDPNLPKIMVIPQDMGRVLLNLINNAFQSPLTPEGGIKKVVVKTFFIPPSEKAPSGEVGASVSDNGSGMSPETKAKIFQPFFTTKPTGQGTGLGLSLAYDIVIKGHGGIIECESIEGEGTTFVVKLPI